MTTFYIRDTVTGETRPFEDDFVWDGFSGDALEGLRYQWFDGNFACDCNRADFFGYDGDDEIECNTGANRFVIDRIVLPDGSDLPAEQMRPIFE